MIKVSNKLYNWASDIDPRAIEQAERTASLSCVERVALMPDAHVGIGSTVGSVIGTHGAIIPAAVGVDIGCGMAAIRFDATAADLPDSLEDLLISIEEVIPAGVGKGHGSNTKVARIWLTQHQAEFYTELDERLTEKILTQMGTLGSGNHFVELCLDENDAVWLVLHSGSRGIGNMLATRHIKQAQIVCAEQGIMLEDRDLAYFEENTDGFIHYMRDLFVLQDFAYTNRQVMLAAAVDQIQKCFPTGNGRDYGRNVMEVINCHHNYTSLEEHDGHMIYVTRKGAIDASKGKMGIIPGSMGTRSYIVRGLGEPQSYHSCSHGAGRRMSRTQAKKQFTFADLAKSMEGKTWLKNKGAALVDEISASYKDIDQVMADQTDLVEPVHTLRQIMNYKGC